MKVIVSQVQSVTNSSIRVLRIPPFFNVFMIPRLDENREPIWLLIFTSAKYWHPDMINFNEDIISSSFPYTDDIQYAKRQAVAEAKKICEEYIKALDKAEIE